MGINPKDGLYYKPMSNTHKTVLKNLILENNIKVMVEVGVCRGALCRSLLGNCHKQIKEYWAVDPWKDMGKGHGKSSRYDDERWETLYLRNCERMIKYPQLHIVRSKSLNAVNMFPDHYFDLVYLDGNHNYIEIKKDIILWLPKVKKGGILAGHDYYKKTEGVYKAVQESFGTDFTEKEDTVWIKQL